MPNKRFIQNTAALFMPHLKWDIDQSINYAQRLWQRLEERGLGDKVQRENPRKDYWKLLTEHQQGYFTRFWDAFNYKSKCNKKDAIRAFYHLGELDDDTYELIIYAAGKEAEARLGYTNTPIHAQGWLSGNRYEGYKLPTDQPDAPKADVQLSHIRNEIQQAERNLEMFADNPEMQEFWEKEKQRLTDLDISMRN